MIQSLLTDLGQRTDSLQLNSLIESSTHQKIKVCNFQALIDNNYSHNSNKNRAVEELKNLVKLNLRISEGAQELSVTAEPAAPIFRIHKPDL